MSEALVEIVAAPDHSGLPRWRAVASCGSVTGTAELGPGAELDLHVEPAWRRLGIGSRLLAAVRAGNRGSGLHTDIVEDSPGEAFCLRHGFRLAGQGRRELLTYCDVHQAWLGELVDAEHPGYRLSLWTGDLDGLRVEDLLRTPSRPGSTVLIAADADGDLAAWAMAVAGARPVTRARQYGPAVLPGHRGRRLGLWVNAALIRRLHELHPHVTEIEAVAGEGDAVRRHLGFHPLRRYELLP
ncbi:GNAT family N-acetyltransferase [Actinoplanes sp. NPDC051861]|uniref:GNAT family N-acetyltransferase n=1 Tax=Actinoplanes sp. NPDC051861 TaxID=3155170 RepID=UPI0034493178